MSRYKIKLIEELKNQLALAPTRVRERQITELEKLVPEIEPSRVYTYEYVFFRITNHRPSENAYTTFDGTALQGDLLTLLAEIDDSLNTHLHSIDEPIYSLGEIEEMYDVSSKTLQRWRKKGLASRRFVYNGYAKKVFVRKSVLDKFVSRNRAKIYCSTKFSRMTQNDKQTIIAKAKDYAATGTMCFSEVTKRISEEVGRSREAVRYTIRRYDQQHPYQPIFPGISTPLTESDKEKICELYESGVSVAVLARRYGKGRATIHRIINQVRATQILDLKVEYIHNHIFEDPQADKIVLGDAQGDIDPNDLIRSELAPKPSNAKDLPEFLQRLYEIPLLSRAEEADFFRKYNFCKYRLAQLQMEIDPTYPKASLINKALYYRSKAEAYKNRLISANLRLVVNIAKRHVGPLADLFELTSDGYMCLIRAVEKFDYSRGNKFSTYATWALMKNFARTIPEENYILNTFVTGQEEILETVVDRRAEVGSKAEWLAAIKDSLQRMLSKLTDRERIVITHRFGIGENQQPQTLEEIGRIIGVTRERVRQIEAQVLRKLRALAELESIEAPSY